MWQNVGGRLPNRPHRAFTSGRGALHFEHAATTPTLPRKEEFGRANGGATMTKADASDDTCKYVMSVFFIAELFIELSASSAICMRTMRGTIPTSCSVLGPSATTAWCSICLRVTPPIRPTCRASARFWQKLQKLRAEKSTAGRLRKSRAGQSVRT